MISPYRIEYNTFSSIDFDLICDVAFDSDSGTTSSFLSREAVASETYRGHMKHVSTYKYSESFAPVITFIDKNFGDFTVERQRQILKWITSKDTPSFLNIYHDDSNVVSYAILGAFTGCEIYKLGNGRVVGFQCTFESVMPFALSDLYTITKTITATDNKIAINIDTDDSKPVYPRVTIQQNGLVVNVSEEKTFDAFSDMVENTVYYNGATYYWKTAPGTDERYFNSSDDEPNEIKATSVKLTNINYDFLNRPAMTSSVIIKNNTGTEKVVLDGANKIVASSNTRRIIGDDLVDWRWLELYDGKNEITVEGNCTVTIEYREPRKVGGY